MPLPNAADAQAFYNTTGVIPIGNIIFRVNTLASEPEVSEKLEHPGVTATCHW